MNNIHSRSREVGNRTYLGFYSKDNGQVVPFSWSNQRGTESQ